MMTSEVRRPTIDGAMPHPPSSRPTGRLRVTGILQLARRGPVVLTGEGAWLLETDDDLRSLVGRTIVAEGERQGLDHIRTDYVALAQAAS